jgi:hypothetical protein
MQTLRLKPISNRIEESLYRTSRSTILDELFHRGAKIHVLGGAVRDSIAFEFDREADWAPRDFDIGVSAIEPAEFEYLLSAFGEKNRHGGFVVKEQGFPTWDLWLLESSIGLRKTGAPFSLENVLRSFNLDCNAVALNVRTGVLSDSGAIEAIRRKRVDFVSYVLKHSLGTFAAKALLTEVRFGYALSAALASLIETRLDSNTLMYESRKVFPQLPLIGERPLCMNLAV